MGGGVTMNHAYTLADILGAELSLDLNTGEVTGRGSFKASLGAVDVEFPIDVVGGAGSEKGAFAVARSRGNLLLIVGRTMRGGALSTSHCALVDVAARPEWRGWLAATKARSFEGAVRELGKAVVVRFSREKHHEWRKVG